MQLKELGYGKGSAQARLLALDGYEFYLYLDEFSLKATRYGFKIENEKGLGFSIERLGRAIAQEEAEALAERWESEGYVIESYPEEKALAIEMTAQYKDVTYYASVYDVDEEIYAVTEALPDGADERTRAMLDAMLRSFRFTSGGYISE